MGTPGLAWLIRAEQSRARVDWLIAVQIDVIGASLPCGAVVVPAMVWSEPGPARYLYPVLSAGPDPDPGPGRSHTLCCCWLASPFRGRCCVCVCVGV